MRGDGNLSWGGLAVRLVLAIVLVYATWNPWGHSFIDWAVMPILRGTDGAGPAPLRFLLGITLLVGWVLALQATRRSLGLPGALLVIAFCAGFVWLLASWQVFAVKGAVLIHAALLVVSIVLAVGVSWSHLSRRFSGQVDTDNVA